jgi:hypothetical protein
MRLKDTTTKNLGKRTGPNIAQGEMRQIERSMAKEG